MRHIRAKVKNEAKHSHMFNRMEAITREFREVRGKKQKAKSKNEDHLPD